MNKQLEEEIIAVAPYMFTYDGADDVRHSLLPFGFECGDGWAYLLKCLVKEISDADYMKSTQVCQVKQKFGGLRFYTNISLPEVDDIIAKYESLSYKTCEFCGHPATKQTRGWIASVCDKCYEENKK